MKHRTGVLIGTLLLTIFLVSTIFPASAYSYSGNKWDATYVVPKKDSTIPSSWSSALTAATDTWNNAGASFTFRWMTSEPKTHYLTRRLDHPDQLHRVIQPLIKILVI